MSSSELDTLQSAFRAGRRWSLVDLHHLEGKNTFTWGGPTTSASTNRFPSTAGRGGRSSLVRDATRAMSGRSRNRRRTICADHETGGTGGTGDPQFQSPGRRSDGSRSVGRHDDDCRRRSGRRGAAGSSWIQVRGCDCAAGRTMPGKGLGRPMAHRSTRCQSAGTPAGDRRW